MVLQLGTKQSFVFLLPLSLTLQAHEQNKAEFTQFVSIDLHRSIFFRTYGMLYLHNALLLFYNLHTEDNYIIVVLMGQIRKRSLLTIQLVFVSEGVLFIVHCCGVWKKEQSHLTQHTPNRGHHHNHQGVQGMLLIMLSLQVVWDMGTESMLQYTTIHITTIMHLIHPSTHPHTHAHHSCTQKPIFFHFC